MYLTEAKIMFKYLKYSKNIKDYVLLKINVKCNSLVEIHISLDYDSGLAQLLLYYSNSIVNISMNVSPEGEHLENIIIHQQPRFSALILNILLATPYKYF